MGYLIDPVYTLMMFELGENCHRSLYRMFFLRASNNSYCHPVFYYIIVFVK